MILEDLGVRKEAFIDLQDLAVAAARTIDDSIDKFRTVVSSHNLGSAYRLRDTLRRLQEDCNMDLKSDGKTIAMDDPFFRKLRRVAMNDILRDIKHSARIPIDGSYLLVGVADEGPAYEKEGFPNVFCLGESEIYGKGLNWLKIWFTYTYCGQHVSRDQVIQSPSGWKETLPFQGVQLRIPEIVSKSILQCKPFSSSCTSSTGACHRKTTRWHALPLQTPEKCRSHAFYRCVFLQ